jgi:hypothetical protein
MTVVGHIVDVVDRCRDVVALGHKASAAIRGRGRIPFSGLQPGAGGLGLGQKGKWLFDLKPQASSLKPY